jgi:hypothetical protein
LPNLQNPFEVDKDASGYATGEVLMQGGKSICYHYGMFHGGVMNYTSMYDHELYTLIQSMKKWKHYLMGKKTIIHTNH